MKRISDILGRKKGPSKLQIDEKTTFYFFGKIIEREYGSQGLKSLKPEFLKGKKLFVKAESSIWANELWLNRQEIAEKLNKKIGSEEIKEIKVKSS